MGRMGPESGSKAFPRTPERAPGPKRKRDQMQSHCKTTHHGEAMLKDAGLEEKAPGCLERVVVDW